MKRKLLSIGAVVVVAVVAFMVSFYWPSPKLATPPVHANQLSNVVPATVLGCDGHLIDRLGDARPEACD